MVHANTSPFISHLFAIILQLCLYEYRETATHEYRENKKAGAKPPRAVWHRLSCFPYITLTLNHRQCLPIRHGLWASVQCPTATIERRTGQRGIMQKLTRTR